MKTIKVTEIETKDEYFYPICNVGYYSFSNKNNHLFIMMADGRNKVTYSMDKYEWEVIEL